MKEHVFSHLLLLLLCEQAFGCGLFFLQRIPSSCIETTTEFSSMNNVSSQCLIYDWNQITTLTTNYTTYIDVSTNETYYAQIGALTVLGQLDDYDTDYQCPPTNYNGVGPDCQTQSDTQLVVLHIRVSNGKLYGIDIILSGAPFPSVESLQDNQPPFGKATHIFPLGIRMQSSGYLKICKNGQSDQCPYRSLINRKLPNPLPSNYGYGLFGIKYYDFVTNSTWIMDDSEQLLIVTAGTQYFYFNRTGYFFFDATKNNCTWSSACNYQCEVYNYNSRFLDYAGQWLITKKWGLESMKPVLVDAWIGNAIDAAGIFPVILYTDQQTGHYLGLDKLDPTPRTRMGATYWYQEHGNTTPIATIAGFHPNVVEVGCAANLTEWMVTKSDGHSLKKYHEFSMIFVLILILMGQNNG